MADLKIQNDLVMATAGEIERINITIKKDFDTVRKAMTDLDREWDSIAASDAMKEFNTIAAKSCDARYDVMDNYVVYLKRQVVPGYESVESANVKLAQAFK